LVTDLVTVNGNSRPAKGENAKRRHGSTLRLWPILDITERIENLADEAMLP